MRLLLAVAVLMLAFVAYTAAEAQEETVEQTITRYGQQMSEVGSALLEKGKDVIERVQNSEVAVASKQWLQSSFEKLKKTMADFTQ